MYQNKRGHAPRTVAGLSFLQAGVSGPEARRIARYADWLTTVFTELAQSSANPANPANPANAASAN
jgi:hypothetical protein